MKTVLEYIFKKHWYVIAGMLAALIWGKYWTVHSVQEMYMDMPYKEQWIQEMYELNMDERDAYLEQLMEELHQIANKDPADTAQTENSIPLEQIDVAVSEYWQLYATHQNQQELHNLIQFAQNGAGVVPIGLPDNYLNLLDFYAQMEEPRLINETPLAIYFDLQRANILPLISFLVLAVYLSIHYETQVHKYVLTTPKGKNYSRQLKWILISLFLGFLAINDLFDLLYSGVILDSNLLNASVQSYSAFENAQIHATIGDCIFYIFAAKILGTLVICQLTDLIAWITKNTKDTTVGGAFLFLFLFLFSQTMESSKLIALIQIGPVNWEQLISRIRICLPIGVSYATIGLGITLVLAIGSTFILKKLHRNF